MAISSMEAVTIASVTLNVVGVIGYSAVIAPMRSDVKKLLSQVAKINGTVRSSAKSADVANKRIDTHIQNHDK